MKKSLINIAFACPVNIWLSNAFSVLIALYGSGVLSEDDFYSCEKEINHLMLEQKKDY